MCLVLVHVFLVGPGLLGDVWSYIFLICEPPSPSSLPSPLCSVSSSLSVLSQLTSGILWAEKDFMYPGLGVKIQKIIRVCFSQGAFREHVVFYREHVVCKYFEIFPRIYILFLVSTILLCFFFLLSLSSLSSYIITLSVLTEAII